MIRPYNFDFSRKELEMLACICTAAADTESLARREQNILAELADRLKQPVKRRRLSRYWERLFNKGTNAQSTGRRYNLLGGRTLH
jgi:hypothetical protein